MTAPDGTSTNFSSATGTPPLGLSPGTPNTLTLSSGSGSGSDRFTIRSAIVNGVSLSYTSLGDWKRITNGVQSIYFTVSGVPTIASDMPKSGTATYQTSVTGTWISNGLTPYVLDGNSTASFSANFGAGTVSTTLDLAVMTSVNSAPLSLGSYTGTGTISATGPGFTGTLTSAPSNTAPSTGMFTGAFFGPQAKEMGYGWYLANGSMQAQGMVVGTK